MTGFRAVMGSWKIIAIFSPRSRRRPRVGCFSTSTPCSRTWPATALSVRGFRPITAKAVTDLPDPDSPTTQRSSPASTEKLTPSTAKGRSAPLGRLTESPRMSRTGALTSSSRSHLPRNPGVEGVAQAVAHDVHRQHGHGERDARVEDDPGDDLAEDPQNGRTPGRKRVGQ